MNAGFGWMADSLEDFEALLNDNEFNEEPVDLDTFLSDPYYMGSLKIKKISDIQRKIIEAISQVYKYESLVNLYGQEEADRLWGLTVHEVIAMLGKGSNSAEARVWVPELGYKKIIDLVDVDAGFTVDTPYGQAKASTAAWKEGRGEMLKVTTKLGIESRVYVGHKYQSLSGVPRKEYLRRNIADTQLEFKRADELSVGDWLPIRLGWSAPLNPVDISGENARWIGYMLGDGSWQDDGDGVMHTPSFTNSTEGVQRDWLDITSSIGCDIRKDQSGYGCDRFFATGGSRWGGNEAKKLLSRFRLEYKPGEPKPWSEDLWNLSDECSIELIRGLWATDGYLCCKNNNASIGVDLTSKDIIVGIQQLLFRLGIVSSVKKKANKKLEHHRDVWRLTIDNAKGCTKFLDLLQDYIPGKTDAIVNVREKLATIKSTAGQIFIESDGAGEFYLDKIISIEEDGEDDFYTLTVDDAGCYMADGLVHSNSGKDFSSRVGFAYAIYKLHCLRDPIEYYGKAHGTYIDLLNIAINADQARNVFFSPLTNMLKMSPYFVEQGFEPRKDSIEFHSCPIRIHSGNSEAEAWEGLDLLLVVLDEIAAFKSDAQFSRSSGAQRLSASAIYKMSKLSVMSRFPELGKCILLSFPRYRGDFIMQRYEESAEESHVLRIKAATYEVNPMITREMLEPEYKRNPIEAKARFECEPPEMVDAFFRDPERVRKCFRGNWEVRNKDTKDEKLIIKENPELNPIDDEGRLKPWFKCMDDHTRFIHVDLGLKRDRAALCMAHSPGTRKVEVEFGVWEHLPVIKMDLIHYWEAGPGQEIDFQNIREFIKLLAKKFPVGMVTFDRWNSVDMIQILNKRGIYAEQHSIRKADYDSLATAMYDGRFTGYFSKILVEDELLKLQVRPNGKIDHPEGMHDDLAQALAGACWHAAQFVDMDSEIDISVLGEEDDFRAIEAAEAREEDRQRNDGRVRPHSQMTYDEDDGLDFEIMSI